MPQPIYMPEKKRHPIRDVIQQMVMLKFQSKMEKDLLETRLKSLETIAKLKIDAKKAEKKEGREYKESREEEKREKTGYGGSTLLKLLTEQKQYPMGSKEWKLYDDRIKKLSSDIPLPAKRHPSLIANDIFRRFTRPGTFMGQIKTSKPKERIKMFKNWIATRANLEKKKSYAGVDFDSIEFGLMNNYEIPATKPLVDILKLMRDSGSNAGEMQKTIDEFFNTSGFMLE